MSKSRFVRHPARWLLWSALAVHIPIALVSGAQSRLPNYDFDRYYEIATTPGRPYVDFPVELAPGTLVAFRALGSIAGDRERFGVSLVTLSAIADAAIAAALGWGWGIEAAAAYALIVIPLADLFFLRYDLWSTAFVTIAMAAWRNDRRVLSAFSLAAGSALKLWPLAFFVLMLVPARSRVRFAGIAAAAFAGCAIFAGWLALAGRSGLYQVFTFRGARGWEIESTVGGIWMLLDRSSMRVESGAWRIGTTIGLVSILLFALAAVPYLWMMWRGGRTGHLGAGWIGGVSTLLVLSATLSPQYAAWLAPGSAIAWAENDRRLAILAALAVFLTNLVWKSFTPLLRGATDALVLLQARNAMLAVLAFAAARLLARLPADSGSVRG